MSQICGRSERIARMASGRMKREGVEMRFAAGVRGI
jgi:hypothetical protein